MFDLQYQRYLEQQVADEARLAALTPLTRPFPCLVCSTLIRIRISDTQAEDGLKPALLCSDCGGRKRQLKLEHDGWGELLERRRQRLAAEADVNRGEVDRVRDRGQRKDCPSCGTPIDPTARTCRNCRWWNSELTQEPAPVETPDPEPELSDEELDDALERTAERMKKEDDEMAEEEKGRRACATCERPLGGRAKPDTTQCYACRFPADAAKKGLAVPEVARTTPARKAVPKAKPTRQTKEDVGQKFDAVVDALGLDKNQVLLELMAKWLEDLRTKFKEAA